MACSVKFLPKKNEVNDLAMQTAAFASIAAIYLANRASRNQQFDFPLPTTGYVD